MLLAEYCGKLWESWGIKNIFAVSGANIEDFLYILERKYQFNIIIAKHEFGACTMAQGAAFQTGLLNVVCTTSGGGALNLVPALAEAYHSRIPLLAIVGQVSTVLEGKGPFQESTGKNETVNFEPIFQSVSTFCHKVTDIETFPEILQLAIKKINQEKRPAVLLLPKNFQLMDIGERALFYPKNRESYPVISSLPPFVQYPKRTMMIIGDCGWKWDLIPQLQRLQEQLSAVVAVTPNGKSFIDHHASYFAGVIGVMGHLQNVRRAIEESERIIFIGGTFSQMDLAGFQNIIQNKEIYFLNDHPLHYLAPHTQTIIGPLAEILPKVEIAEENLNLTHSLSMTFSKSEEDPFLSQLNDLIREQEADLFIDAGNCGALAVHHLNPRPPQKFLVALGMGGMGYSFGTAIGSTIISRKRTYLFAGDGAFFMHGMEIHTAIEHNLPITFVIINNNAHAMCSLREELYHRVVENSCNQFLPSKIAIGLGAMFPTLPAFELKEGQEIATLLPFLREYQGPVVISYQIEATEMPPFLPFKEIPRC